MQSGPALSPESLIAENAKILELVFQDAFYGLYSAESTVSGAKIGLTEYYPNDLVTRAPSGDVLLQSLELQNLFNLGRERFIAEAKALSALRHPNLLRFDGIISDHGTAFALHAPEEGQSLTNVAKSSKQLPSQAVIDAIVNKLVSALDLLHSRNLVHANITPDTILLRPDPLLIRFGSARSYLAARMQKVNLAVTPGYSAPELHFSDEKAHGPLCDVYSLAAVLYFIATGRHPISVIARGLGQTMPPAAALSSQRFRPQFLEAIDRGLELEPERRPPTIKAFGEMLLGIPEENAPESTEPTLQVTAAPSKASQACPRPTAPLSDGSPLSAKISTPQPSMAPVAAEDEEDDELDDHEDFGSSWQGLGIGRLLVLALVLALVVSACLWMLEAQFKKQEQATRLDPGNALGEQTSGRSPSQEQPSPAPSPTARPPQQTEITAAEPAKRPSAIGQAAPPVKEASREKPRAKPNETIQSPQKEYPQVGTLPAPSLAVATAICGFDARASEVQSRITGANGIMESADKALESRLVEEFLRQSCPVSTPHQKTDQLAHKLKEAEEKHDAAGERMETSLEVSSARVSGQEQRNEVQPDTKPESQRAGLEPVVRKNQSLTFEDCESCPKLVAVPEGSFLMGSPPHEEGRGRDNGEGPQRRVTIEHSFAVGRFAITVAEFKEFVDDTGYRTGDLCAAGNEYIARSAGSFEAPPGFAAGFVQSGRHPVVCVSWLDAKAYVAWLSHKTKRNYRLLTEAEREYVTRAGTSTAYWWGDEITPAQAVYDASPASTQRPEISAAVNVPSSGGTTPVDQFQPNAWGLFQVHGNVAEWVEDCWRPTLAAASNSSAAAVWANCTDHALRGGAWSYPKTALRSAFREHAPAGGRYNHVGFRVARDLDEQ